MAKMTQYYTLYKGLVPSPALKLDPHGFRGVSNEAGGPQIHSRDGVLAYKHPVESALYRGA